MELQEERAIDHPILMAALYNRIQTVRKFLDLDKDLCKKVTQDGSNLLHLINNQKLFKELVLLDPTLLRQKNKYGNYPIHSCLSYSKPFIKWVIEQDLEQLYLRNENDNLLIHLCICRNFETLSIAEWILSQDFSLAKQKNEYGFTALHLAMQSSHFDLAELLIKRDPKLVFERDKEGCSPIAYVSYHENSTDFLLWFFKEFPELIKEKSFGCRYPIHIAAEEGNLELVEYLIEKTPQELLEK